jgi:PAP2 superfamily
MTFDVQSELGYTAASPALNAAAAQQRVQFALPRRRAMFAVPLVALVSMVAAVVLTRVAGVPVRDPDNVTGNRLVLAIALVLALVGLDLLARAWTRSEGRRVTPAALGAIRREDWPLWRALSVASAVIGFYVSYLAYRNLKSVVPLVRPGDLYDAQLASFDRHLFAGHDPADLMHGLLGTGFATHVFSFAYMLLFLFIPATLAAALVFSRDVRGGLFYATAQSLNWLLGAASYFLLPSLGPIYADPGAFAGLAQTEAGHLQALLLQQRLEFLRDPAIGTAQSIGAFASLHVSIFVTGALAAQLLGLPRAVKVIAWVLAALTVGATIQLGWHYFADDLGGVAIAVLSVGMARVLTGIEPRATRQESVP